MENEVVIVSAESSKPRYILQPFKPKESGNLWRTLRKRKSEIVGVAKQEITESTV